MEYVYLRDSNKDIYRVIEVHFERDYPYRSDDNFTAKDGED